MFSKKLIYNLVIALACSLGVASAETMKFPISWVLTPGANPACTALPPTVTVTGAGEQHFTSHVTKNPDGSFTMTVQSVATGEATDNNGVKYRWAYVNHLTFNLTSPYRGHFTDQFDLISQGKSPNMKVFLDWDVYIDPGHPPQELPFFSTFIQGTTHGDPYCDPI
jgi:hypothetical protein